MSEKIVVFGAGATGRGHVGLLAWQGGGEMILSVSFDKKAGITQMFARFVYAVTSLEFGQMWLNCTS